MSAKPETMSEVLTLAFVNARHAERFRMLDELELRLRQYIADYCGQDKYLQAEKCAQPLTDYIVGRLDKEYDR